MLALACSLYFLTQKLQQKERHRDIKNQVHSGKSNQEFIKYHKHRSFSLLEDPCLRGLLEKFGDVKE